MLAIFNDDDPPPATPSVRSSRGGTRPPGIDDPDCGPGNALVNAPEPAIDQPESGYPVTLWPRYGARRLEPQTKEKKDGEWTCPQHGPLCNPGICQEWEQVVRDKRMRDEREKWEEEKRQREAKYQKKRDKEKKNTMGENERYRPPHLRRGNASSGSNSSSSDNNSDNNTDTSRDRGAVFPTTSAYTDLTASVLDSSALPSPDQEDRKISWDARGTDVQPTVSSARHAWDSGSESDEDDYDHDDDGTRSRTTNTGSAVSRNSRPPLPASVSSSGRSKVNAGPTQVPQTRQSAWDACSASGASQSPSGVAESVWPSVSGFSNRTSSVSAASVTGSDTGQRSGSRRLVQDARSSVSSSARDPVTPSATPSSAKDFPTFADTHWGDPIAMALAAMAKEDSRIKGGKEASEEGGQKASKNARKRRNRAESAQAQVLATQLSAVELDIQLPPGGPGSSWGDPDGEPW